MCVQEDELHTSRVLTARSNIYLDKMFRAKVRALAPHRARASTQWLFLVAAACAC